MNLTENAKQGRPSRQISQYVIEDIKTDSFRTLKEEGFNNIDDESKFINCKPDAIIYNPISKNIIGIIEWKNDHTKNKEKKALGQLKDYSDVVKEACIFIFTDGKKTKCFNNQFKIINNQIKLFDELCTKKSLSDQEQYQLNYLKIFFDLVSDNLSRLKSDNPPTLLESQIKKINLFSFESKNKAREIWQKLWIATGEEPLPCLHTFVELLVFKILSDLGILTFPHDLNTTLQADASLNHYYTSGRQKIKTIFAGHPSIINGFVFNKQDSEFCSILKDINKIGDFSIDLIHTDFKRKLMEYFLKQGNVKIRNGQHLTPRNIINAIWKMSEIEKGDTVFDPACGVGGFLLEYFNLTLNENSKIEDLYDITLKGYDISDKMIVLAKANFIMHTLEMLRTIEITKDNEGKINSKHFNDYLKYLNDSFQSISNTGFGSLAQINEAEFADVIITNPPFVSEGSGLKKKEMSKKMKNYYKECGFYIEGMFIRYIINCLKKGGEAITIVPYGVLTRVKDKAKDDILSECHLKAIISLPSRVFDNTGWKTYILFLQRKNDENEKYRKPIFLYNVENVGFTLDANRIECESDLDDLVERYNRYVKEGADSTDIISDKCMVIKQGEFAKLDNWEEAFDWCKDNKENEKHSISDLLDITNLIKGNINILLEDLTLDLEEQENIQFVQKKLGDEFCFEFFTSALGFTQKQYIPLDTKNKSDIPIYTAQLNAVAYIKKRDMEPNKVCQECPHISVASDGDGTAGKNIVLHKRPYYLNTSRISFKVNCNDILPEYVFYAIQDIKQKYSFDYKYKCNLTNLKKVELKLPIKLNENGEPIKVVREIEIDGEVQKKEDYLYDIEKQRNIIDNMNNIKRIKNNLEDEVKELLSYMENAKGF